MDDGGDVMQLRGFVWRLVYSKHNADHQLNTALIAEMRVTV